MAFNPLGGKFFQLGYVTRNLDAATELFATYHGIPKFLIAATHDIADWPGPQARVAMAYRADVMIEIIEPAGDPGMYREAMPSGDGVNLHHLAYFVSPAAWSTLRADMSALGLPVVFETPPSLPLRGLFVDTRRTHGHHFEFVCDDDEAAKLFAPTPRY